MAFFRSLSTLSKYRSRLVSYLFQQNFSNQKRLRILLLTSETIMVPLSSINGVIAFSYFVDECPEHVID
jgi:hypothetical protein